MPDAAERTTSSAVIHDATWYKNAVIYQLHVRSFYDSNGDGIGDFRGLTEKLDYIQELGVTAIWLLPFFPSPLKDDGYDIADYTNVNPIYGALRDFRSFLQEAHRRDLRVITELVMNHTSDQHAWFQKSRRAPAGSKWRNYYVWSDTPQPYADARIIFKDFEPSNWTWDGVAQAYFWHRFYSHQPDLNFDNPEVRKVMLATIDFWLDMGVDGVRLDAVPYLYEREGTNCENLPETHQFLRDLRAHVDNKYTGRMLLAEANQWPEDAVAYFGDGDECHMNFHFPLMPRLFMAMEREDRFPIVDIMDQTPPVPEGCQWAIFLRNHDELTLEMVTDEERDYMYRVYAEDHQARINLGIRRRLAPLLKNNRRKMELMNGLLLSLPGTPVVYYGDEIGMGDNIFLGDRNGVRTPMQWNSDRNAGFSRANPQRLFLPTIIDSEYHCTVRNVEVEHNSPHSMLWWMRRIINLRKQHASFGNGTIEFLAPDNSKVLAYLRQHGDETILVVANLSRYVQQTQLDLSRFRGQAPIEMFGQAEFPPVGELPYFFMLGPYGFYWFRLQWTGAEEGAGSIEALPQYELSNSWETVLQGRARAALEKVLPAFLARHRWYAGKAKAIQGAKIRDSFAIPGGPKGEPIYLLLVEARYTEGEPDVYQVPVIFADEPRAQNILGDHPQAGIMVLQRTDNGQQRTLCEATWEREFWQPMMQLLSKRRSLQGERGGMTTMQTKAFRKLVDADVAGSLPAVHGGQQSNTSVVFGDRVILKMFRRIKEGTNPDLEIGRFLTEHTKFEQAPRVAGAIEYQDGGEPMTLAVLHEYKPNEGDAWVFTLDELGRYLEQVEARIQDLELAKPPKNVRSLLEMSELEPPETAREALGSFLPSAEQLGRRTAQLHKALASGDEEGFRPDPFSKLYQRSLYQSMRAQVRRVFTLLRKRQDKLPQSLQPLIEKALQQETNMLDQFRDVLDRKIDAQRIRCHGDYHLGQVLYTGKDFVIIDFEGEPERAMSERRIKTSPLKDVAGMIRSFHYATHAALLHHERAQFVPPDRRQDLLGWGQLWYAWTSGAFLRAYLAETSDASFLPTERDQLETLLNAYVLEKAVYELHYELNNRPDWVGIPLEAVVELATRE